MIKIKYCFFKKLVNVLSSDYIMNLNNNTNKDKSCFKKINEKFIEKKTLMNEINNINKEYY